MNISFEIAGDSVGIGDLVTAAEPLGLSARVSTVLKLGKHGPKPGLMVTFDAIPDQCNSRNLVADILESLELAGIEVDHG